MTLARRNLPAIREAQQGAAETVPHLDAQAVRRLIESARSASQTGERNGLLSPPSTTALSASQRPCGCVPWTWCARTPAGPRR